MRRLPVYLLLDTSGSMMGEPIEAVKNGLQTLLAALRQDPYALETAYLSVITFESAARQLVPLTDLASFKAPDLRAGGATALGDALGVLAQCIDREVAQNTPQQKGDWKPLIFLMTDGGPTDSWKTRAKELRQRKLGLFIACAAGPGADVQMLKALTEIVVQLDTADSATIKAFFKWVSQSVSSGSQKVEQQKEVAGLSDLPPPPPEINVVI